MQLLRKKCELCGVKISRGEEIFENVKVPEFKGFMERPFCSKNHAEYYDKCVKGTKRTSFCPTCPIGN